MNFSAQLHEYLQEREGQNLFSGVVLITKGANPLYSAAYGYASRAWKIPNSLNIRFDTASMTKIFTAVATLQLIEQDLLTFQTSAMELLGIEDTTISKAVNVYHLLTHTSGIGDDAEEEAGEEYEDLWKTNANYSVLTTHDHLPRFIHKPPNFPPGEGCRYCNVSFILLGLMIEKVTGMTYHDYIRQHVFKRAGMDHCDFYRMDRVNENVAEGADPIYDDNHRLTEWKRNIYSYPPIGCPSDGAYATAGDIDIFLHALKAGQLLSAEFTKDFLTPKVVHHENEQYVMKVAYGLEYYLMKSGDFSFYQKEGINAGTSGVMRHYPKQDINVILLSNMMKGVWQPLKEIHDLISAS